MKYYENEVIEAAKKRKNKRFANSNIEHAKLLIKEIIMTADKEIFLLTSNFHEDFYSSLSSYLEKFLSKKDAKLNIVMATNPNGFLQKLQKKFPNKIIIKVAKKEEFPIDSETKEKINYIINDNNSFRYEYSEKDIEQGIVEAIANFNSPSEARILKEHFNSFVA